MKPRHPILRAAAIAIAVVMQVQSAAGQSRIPPSQWLQPAPGAWLPRCGGQVRANCYIWLCGADGLCSHIYQAAPLNCQQSPTNPACEQSGNEVGNGGPSTELTTQECFNVPSEQGKDLVTGQDLHEEWQNWCSAWQELLQTYVLNPLSSSYGSKRYSSGNVSYGYGNLIYFQYRAATVQYSSDGYFGFGNAAAVGTYPTEQVPVVEGFQRDAFNLLVRLRNKLIDRDNQIAQGRVAPRFRLAPRFPPGSKYVKVGVGNPGVLPCPLLIYINPPPALANAPCPWPKPGSLSDSSSPLPLSQRLD